MPGTWVSLSISGSPKSQCVVPVRVATSILLVQTYFIVWASSLTLSDRRRHISFPQTALSNLQDDLPFLLPLARAHSNSNSGRVDICGEVLSSPLSLLLARPIITKRKLSISISAHSSELHDLSFQKSAERLAGAIRIYETS